jgi:hypothetical protein
MQPIRIKPENMQLVNNAIGVALEAGSFEMVIRAHDSSVKARQRMLANIWYKQIGEDQGVSIGAAEAYCKYKFGLKASSFDDPDREAAFRAMLSGHSYEIKLQIIEDLSDLFPILRANGGLNSHDTGLYLTAIQRHFAEQGLILASSNETELLNCKAANAS